MRILCLCFVLLVVSCVALGVRSAETTAVLGRIQDSDSSLLVATISILSGSSTRGIETHDTSSRGRSPLGLGSSASSPSPQPLTMTDNQGRSEP